MMKALPHRPVRQDRWRHLRCSGKAIGAMVPVRRTSVVRLVLLVSAFLIGAGCAANRTPRPDVDYAPSLLTGERMFGEEVSLDEVPDADLLRASDAMTEFVHERVGGTRLAITRFKRLLAALSEEGYFNTVYDPARTQNAAATFASRSGNCLSYTTMFIALSRVVGLDASYQVVNVPPTWDADSGFLIRYTHINALLRDVQVDRTAGTTDVTIDFNTVQPDPQYDRHVVTDDYAAALFYANRSVDHARRGELRVAFGYLRKAITLAPDNPDLWVNLGAIYSRSDDFLSAVESYEVALAADPGNKGAISGLARAWANHGDAERAEVYASRVKRYRERNPFFHFAVAQAEYEREAYDRALESINTAIDLRHREGEFHFLKGLTLYKLGDRDGARESFSQAERYGRYRDLKLRYIGEFAGVSQPLPN